MERQVDFSIGYAGCYLNAERERHNLLLKIGSDDQVKVYLNGKEILRSARPRALTADEDVVGVNLKQGTNVLLLVVINERLDWSACARVTERDGQPAADVKVTLTPR